MDSLKKVIGVFLILVAAIVAIHTVIEPLYHTSAENTPYSPNWKVINYFSAISLVLGIIISFIRKNNVSENSTVQEYIAANTLFYGFLFTTILFLWNWFALFKVAEDFTAVGSETRSMVWITVDAIFPLLNGAMGMHLLRAKSSD